MNNNIKTDEIPIFFSTDDNYIPYLDVAISSLIANASKEFTYRIVVLHTGLNQENINLVNRNECDNFIIDFVDISRDVENIKDKFKNVYHFSIVTYYRLFIASLFPQYDKILYIDCDLIVLGDISKLYHTDLEDNILGGVIDQFVSTTEEFRLYAERAVGVNPDTYINAGVLVINLAEFRKQKIEEKFVDLITSYDFDLLDPDQAYLNFLCKDKIHLLQNGWNKAPTPLPCDGKKQIVHYNLYKKPWQYDDIIDGEYFWQYAENSPFYDIICQRKDSFGEKERAEKDATATEILVHALKIIESEETFAKRLQMN